jgi:Protein of unknown function (DUF4056)
MYLLGSGRALGSLARSPLGQAASLVVTFTDAERQAVKMLIDQEVHNENALTDRVFFRRHPLRKHPLRGGPELVSSERVEWIAIRDRLVRPMLAAVPINIPFRPCCLFGPAPAPFVDPTKLGAHKVVPDVQGILYTGRAGFIDLGHLRETCDLTEFAWTRLQGSGGLPVVIPTIHGEATITKPVPPNRWVVVAQAIANDDALGHEILTYDMPGAGRHNSSFSPEDLCSNFVGTVVGRLAIGEGGVFPRKVDAKLASVLKNLRAQPLAETQKAFDKIKTKWVNFVDDTSWRNNDYLRRRNFTRRPFKVGHPSDAATPAWVLASFGDAETFYTYKHTLGKTIAKTSFAAEIQRIRVDARARYGDQFDQP